MKNLIVFTIPIIFCSFIFSKTLLVPEEFLRIQQAVVSAQNGDTVSVNFGRPNGQRITVTTSRIFCKEITFEVRGEGKGELLEKIKEIGNVNANRMNDLQNTESRNRSYPPQGWQGQRQVNDPDTLPDASWGHKDIKFDNQNTAWVVWGGTPQGSVNWWAYSTYWTGQGWAGDLVAISLPGPERWNALAVRGSIGIDNQPCLVCHIAHPSNLRDIFYTHYNGSVWEPKIMVNLPDSTELDFQPHIASNGNRMWANWFGGPTDISLYKIYASRWNGNGWDSEEVISFDDNYHDWFQNLGVDSRGNPHIVWIALDTSHYNNDVIFYRYHDGNRWLEPETVSQGLLLYENFHWSCLDIGLDENDNPHIIFDAKIPAEPSFDVFYSKRENGSWIEPMRITDNEYREGGTGIAVSNSQNIWTFWWRELGQEYPLLLRHYDGQVWSPEMTLETPLSLDNYPSDIEFDHLDRLWVIYCGQPIGGRWGQDEIWFDVYSPQSVEEKIIQNHNSKTKSVKPNPFVRSVTISYNITKPSAIAISVFDKLGNRLNSLGGGF